jgi:hypothetical protein
VEFEGLAGEECSAHTTVRLLSGAGLSKAFQDHDVGCRSRATELDAISPDRFEDGFVQK